MKRVVVKGYAYGASYDYECEIVSKEDQRAIFRTNGQPSHTIEVQPRYTGSKLGDPDLPDPRRTVCAFVFDGNYAALAFYCEDNEQITITPHEY